MGLFKGLKDMRDMVHAAPDLIESANGLAAQARAHQAAGTTFGMPAAGGFGMPGAPAGWTPPTADAPEV